MKTAWVLWRRTALLFKQPKTEVTDVDIPLATAVSEAKWTTLWTVLMCWLTVWIMGFGPPHYALVWFIAAGVIALPAGYGFFRLYTLVTHVLTLNVFKTRGQRLRLLNLETKLLALAPCYCIALIVMHYQSVVGSLCLCAISVYTLFLITLGYNHIFHKQSAGGLWLWLGSTLVTWFVLFIGALAISVMASVLAFFAILILRSFR